MTRFWLHVRSSQRLKDSSDWITVHTVGRTLGAMEGHGFILDLEHSESEEHASWSYRKGTEDPGVILETVHELVRGIAPEHWVIRVGVSG